MGARRKFNVLQNKRKSGKEEQVIGMKQSGKSGKGSGKFLKSLFIGIGAFILLLSVIFAFLVVSGGGLPVNSTGERKTRTETQPAKVKKQDTEELFSNIAASEEITYPAASAIKSKKTSASAIQRKEEPVQSSSSPSPEGVHEKSVDLSRFVQQEKKTSKKEKEKRTEKPGYICKVLKNDEIIYFVKKGSKLLPCYAAIQNWDGKGVRVRKGQTVKSSIFLKQDDTVFIDVGGGRFVDTSIDTLKCKKVGG